MGKGHGDADHAPLFETRGPKVIARVVYWVYATSVTAAIFGTWIYRVTQLPSAEESLKRWAWVGLFMAELWYSFYWLATQSVRWNPVYRFTFKDKLSQRYEKVLPSIDIFVCTADHQIEPPLMVVNTVLSVMAYNYPPDKLHVYLSDDGCSDLMFYALLEASRFSKHWLPFCRNFNIQPNSPAAYFSGLDAGNYMVADNVLLASRTASIKKLYEEMKARIKDTVRQGAISNQQRKQHKGFDEWDMVSSRTDHHTLLQILILQDGNKGEDDAVDVEGNPLPTLVYLAREKRPQHHHNFKAGAMNALIRVSSKISNSPVILNVDCDMYSNNSDSVRDALCFLIGDDENDSKSQPPIAYVQFFQQFDNITENDIYGNELRIIGKVEFPGADGNGGPLYIGSGCYHRREAISGKKYCGEDEKAKSYTKILDWNHVNTKATIDKHGLEKSAKVVASCDYETNTPWGKEMGLKYGCAVEDVITGLSIKCRGWRSVMCSPQREGFLGVAPMTLLQTLIQHKRWGEGNLQIFLSKYNPFLQGHGRIPLSLQLSYCVYSLWAVNSLPTLYFVMAVPFCLIRNISLFPKLWSLWNLPYAYVGTATCAYSLLEFISNGGTIKGWWNDQRMWLYKRLASYLFAVLDTILNLLGIGKSGFVITAKVADDDVSVRYKKEMMEFGTPSPMFTTLATLALFNIFSLVHVGITQKARAAEAADDLGVELILCFLIVIINFPLYQGMFFRKDKGRMPLSTTYKSLALVAFLFPLLQIAF